MTSDPASERSADTTAWTARDIPPLLGKVAVVTGANSGLGLVTAVELARHGAAVTLACRDAARGGAALEAVRAQAPDASVQLATLDLASLDSVREFAQQWLADHAEGLDILVNNAGVMAVPRSVTVDGHERQFATNHLGHFALTGLLLPALASRPGARVVTVSSNAHKFGRIDFDDLDGAKKYGSWRAYGQSKLANLLFAFELQRRADAAALPLLSMAAHPGTSRTNLVASGPAAHTSGLREKVTHLGGSVMSQPAAMGALPQLYAATAPGVPGGAYVGPSGFLELKGHPRLVTPSKAARDTGAAERLWTVSEGLTGVEYLD